LGVSSRPREKPASDPDLARAEVQVLPLERERFAQPEAGTGHREEERGPVAFLLVGRTEEVSQLLAGERLDGLLALAARVTGGVAGEALRRVAWMMRTEFRASPELSFSARSALMRPLWSWRTFTRPRAGIRWSLNVSL
jgi:hypothetical protein